MPHFIRSAALACLALGISTAAYAAPAKQFPPKDECLSMDGYFDLRQKFEDIVKRRDAKALLAMVSPAISWNFGGEPATKEAFAKNWKLETGRLPPSGQSSTRSCGWDALRKGPTIPQCRISLVRIPARLVRVVRRWLLGPAVNFRSQPNTSSASLRKINWEVVTTLEQSTDQKWTKVKDADGKTGFIRNDYLRGDLDYRIGFEKKEKGWVISFFIAGD